MNASSIASVAAALMIVRISPAAAQVLPDSALATEINRIRAIDNHAHPAGVLAAGERDPEFAVPDSIPPTRLPVRLRQTNPEFVEAWRALYGYPYDFGGDHARELLDSKRRVMRERGDGYPAWVLDQLGIETMLSNRITLGRGLAAPRFLWVWHANPLLFPLDNRRAKALDPQRRADYEQDEAWLQGFVHEVGRTDLPPTLAGYVDEVIVPLLRSRKQSGAVAVKFYAAYMRTLDFADVPEAEAGRVYARYLHDGEPPAGEYKALQDYLFRRIALECGRVGLIVHLHVGVGSGPFFYNSWSSPFLLEPVLNDPRLRGTTFVLLHGGLPFAEATRVLLSKPNVYADFSSQGFLSSPRAMSAVIRSWLELRPEKVLFGTDAYPLTRAIGWEEVGWVSARSGRQALALALTGMIADREIDRTRAIELAHMVLHDNAAHLYGLSP